MLSRAFLETELSDWQHVLLHSTLEMFDERCCTNRSMITYSQNKTWSTLSIYKIVVLNKSILSQGERGFVIDKLRDMQTREGLQTDRPTEKMLLEFRALGLSN